MSAARQKRYNKFLAILTRFLYASWKNIYFMFYFQYNDDDACYFFIFSQNFWICLIAYSINFCSLRQQFLRHMYQTTLTLFWTNFSQIFFTDISIMPRAQTLRQNMTFMIFSVNERVRNMSSLSLELVGISVRWVHPQYTPFPG